MKIGILGGSFDPVHRGHLYMAECAKAACKLDSVWLIPAGHSPNKNETDMTDAKERFAMCQLAAETAPWLSVSRVEIDSTERSYTFRTLQKLTEAYPQHRFYFIMGGDSLDYFEQWMHPEIIAAHAALVVIPRGLHNISQLSQKAEELKHLFPCEVYLVPCADFPLSSTDIREELQKRQEKAEHFPPGVLEYIRAHRLYTREDTWNGKPFRRN